MGQIISIKDVRRILRGLIASKLSGLLLIGCVTCCIQRESFLQDRTAYIVPFVWFIMSLTGSYTAGESGATDKKLLPALVPALVILIQLAVAILVFDGAKGISFLICLVSCIAGGCLGIFLRIRNKKHVHKRKRKHAHR